MFSLDFTAQVLVLNGVFNEGDTISAGTSFSLSNLTIRDFDSGGNDLEVTTFGFVTLSASAAIWFWALSQGQSDAVTKFHLAPA